MIMTIITIPNLWLILACLSFDDDAFCDLNTKQGITSETEHSKKDILLVLFDAVFLFEILYERNVIDITETLGRAALFHV